MLHQAGIRFLFTGQDAVDQIIFFLQGNHSRWTLELVLKLQLQKQYNVWIFSGLPVTTAGPVCVIGA